MQIYELTSGKRNLKEYDPSRSPPGTPNYATGVGPGVTPTMTAPTVTTAQTPADIRKTKLAAAAKIAQDQMAPFSKLPEPAAASGINPELAAASKVKMGAPQGRKANIGGAIANAMQAYNANQVGLGYLLPKDAKNEVYVDSTGKITIDDVPYDAANPEHQRIVGKITIGGKPYNGANPEHRAAYLAFKNTAGRGGRDTVKIDANGGITVLGQPFDPSNPAHVQEYRRYVLGSSVEQTPPPAPAQQPPAAKQPPAAQQPSDVEQALIRLGYAPQQAAALAAKVPPGTDTQAGIKLALANKLNESLTWSRNFDPSRTLLKKIRQL
jgi:hypothetical protein